MKSRLLIYGFKKPLSPWLNKACLITLFSSILILAAPIAQSQDVFLGLTSNGGLEGKGTAYSIKQDGSGFSVIKGFVDWGALPTSDLVRGNDGNFYGMAPDGGSFNHGTLFRITSTGNITILKNFNLTVDGGYPKGSLLLASDGNFYGLTSGGSINNGGAIFKITPSGTYTIIRSLAINTDGGRPQGHLIQAPDGFLYGVNSAGGTYGYGTIFKIKPDGTSYTVLKSLVNTTGSQPYGSLVRASDGNFYGMTYLGGTANRGVIYRITPAGIYTVLRNFTGTTDGQYPFGDLIQAKDGFLYGMTGSAGANGIGTIFKIKTDGTSFTVIRALNISVEGGNVKGSLLQAADGNFYGLTYSTTGGYYGSVFRVTSTGAVTVIKKFTLATEGGYAMGSLIQAPDGLLYGMTNSGGKGGKGTIFKVTIAGTTPGTLTVLSHLTGSAMGNVPQDNLVIGKDSAYFGVTQYGGATNYGTIFKICGGVTSLVRSFTRNTDGGSPTGGLVRANDGNLYGMTETGGSYGSGTIYRITPTGVYTVLRHLQSATDGNSPRSTLVLARDGHMYGMTYSGGASGGGTIFRMTTGGVFTVLKSFVPSTEGSSSEAGLAVGTDGNLYGITGTNPRFFRITTAGVFTILKTFTYTEGTAPFGNLVLGTDNNFYGTMSGGGSYGKGTIFRITNAGVVTILRHINGTTDGSTPKGGLVRGSDGNFYGTTSTGGNNKYGTIFKISSSGTFSVLRHLKIETDGGAPLGGLILAPRNTLVANAQSNLATNEDVAKAITLTGSGGSIFNIVTPPRHGSITSGTTASRTYTPLANSVSKDSFSFTVSTGCLSSTPAWVTINVNSVNDAPVLATIGNKTVSLGSTLIFTATATDPDLNQTRTFSLITPPTGATINATSGAFSWKPAAVGTYTVKVRVTDNGSPVLYDEETITVTVNSTAGSVPVDEPGGNVDEISLHHKINLTIWPNPSSSYFNLKFEATKSKTQSYKNKTLYLRVLNEAGQVVEARSGITINTTLQLGHNYQPGIYIVEVHSGPKKEYAKLIKQ